MSADYIDATKNFSTYIRIGSKIFGKILVNKNFVFLSINFNIIKKIFFYAIQPFVVYSFVLNE